MAERFDFEPLSQAHGGSEYTRAALPEPGEEGGVRFTTASRRLLALIPDYGVPAFFILDPNAGALVMVAYVVMLANVIGLQGATGASIGKRMVGLQLAYCPDKQTPSPSYFLPGVGRCFCRFLLHTLDTILLLGFFRMLIDFEGKSFADSICQTVVIWDDRVRLEERDEYRRRFRNQL